MDLFVSFLKNRKQSVKINDVYSELLEKNHGVPQGTVLGPLVFFSTLMIFEKGHKETSTKFELLMLKIFI